MLDEYRTEPAIDFEREKNRHAMRESLQQVMMQLGGEYPLMIGGQPVTTPDKLRSIDPSFRDRLVGESSIGEAGHVQQAVDVARERLPDWSDWSVSQRVELLRRAAQALRERLFELAAWQVYECGRGWRDAAIDVCQAIDYCEYHAATARALVESGGGDAPHEENRFGEWQQGVAAVIAPWNSPLAIACGMTTAALVAGCTVVLKPAEQSPVCAALLVDLLQQVGLPPGVLNYVPGHGHVAGRALVEHPDVGWIAFAGSRATGQEIETRAAEVSGQEGVCAKRVIAQMGGQNCVVVAGDADLDEAVRGVVESAFGYQGQKCSACRRVVVVEEVYEVFLKRLITATKSLHIGPAEFGGSEFGPVISHEAVEEIFGHIEQGRHEAQEELSVDVDTILAGQGFYVGPHIFADVQADSALVTQEISGPVLAVLNAANLDEAFRIARSESALAAGLYSRSPDNLERARNELPAGRLFFNQPITAAEIGPAGTDLLLQFRP